MTLSKDPEAKNKPSQLNETVNILKIMNYNKIYRSK